MIHHLEVEIANDGCRAECDCGWLGKSHPIQGSGLAALRKANKDYKAHAEDSLGAAAYYSGAVACINCGSEHVQGVLIGTDVWSATCIRCGTSGRLRPKNDAFLEKARRREA